MTSSRHRRIALATLVVVYSFNMADRQILAILVEPIRADLGLSDTQLGLLGGIAFALFYATLGIPIARMADRRDRVSIIAVSLAIWSAMTAACGLAQGFIHLALARVGVGVGEAGCTPPAHSMITDLFPLARRASALAVYQLGGPIGLVSGLLIGGWINEFWGWRTAFYAMGLPGLALAVAVRMLLRDPSRSEPIPSIPPPPEAPGLRAATRELWRIESFRHITIGFALAAFSQYQSGAWFPAFFGRTHGMSTAEVASIIGPLGLVAGVAGTLLGGVLTDRYGARDRRFYVWIPAGALLLSCPFWPWVLLTDQKWIAIAVSVVPGMLAVVFTGPSFAMIQSLAPANLRAVASAIVLLVANLIGLGLGPVTAGLLSDALEPTLGADSLRYALILGAGANLWASWHFVRAARTLRADLVEG